MMNVGVLGSGFIAGVFTDGVKKSYKDVKLYAMWGIVKEDVLKFTDYEKHYFDIDEFMNDPKIDVVYIGLPNSVHYEYAMKALKAGKHVLCEKPFCTTYKEAKSLIDYAKKHKLFLYETMMTKHAPNFQKIKNAIKDLGDIKIVECNFTQYSRRYDKFKNGITLPAFNYKLAGGALMDLGVYNVHFIVDLFGSPKSVHYYPNIEKNIDTAGVLVLDYGKFKAISTAAKNCAAESFALIQGDKGHIRLNSTTSRVSSYSIIMNDGKRKDFADKDQSEFAGWKTLYDDFRKIYNKKDYETCYKYLEDTLKVAKVLEDARKSAKMKF